MTKPRPWVRRKTGQKTSANVMQASGRSNQARLRNALKLSTLKAAAKGKGA